MHIPIIVAGKYKLNQGLKTMKKNLCENTFEAIRNKLTGSDFQSVQIMKKTISVRDTDNKYVYDFL